VERSEAINRLKENIADMKKALGQKLQSQTKLDKLFNEILATAKPELAPLSQTVQDVLSSVHTENLKASANAAKEKAKQVQEERDEARRNLTDEKTASKRLSGLLNKNKRSIRKTARKHKAEVDTLKEEAKKTTEKYAAEMEKVKEEAKRETKKYEAELRRIKEEMEKAEKDSAALHKEAAEKHAADLAKVKEDAEKAAETNAAEITKAKEEVKNELEKTKSAEAALRKEAVEKVTEELVKVKPEAQKEADKYGAELAQIMEEARKEVERAKEDARRDVAGMNDRLNYVRSMKDHLVNYGLGVPIPSEQMSTLIVQAEQFTGAIDDEEFRAQKMIFENVQNPNAAFNFELAVSQLVKHPEYENTVTHITRELYGNPTGAATIMYATLRHPQNSEEWLPVDAMQKLYSYPPYLGFWREYWYTRGATERGRGEDPALPVNVGEALDLGFTLYAWAESEDLEDALVGNIDWVGNVQINGQARWVYSYNGMALWRDDEGEWIGINILDAVPAVDGYYFHGEAGPFHFGYGSGLLFST